MPLFGGSREWFRLNEFFALEKKVAALETVLFRRRFSPAPVVCSSLFLRLKKEGVGGENFFCDTVASSVLMVREFGSAGKESAFSFGGLDELLNILFSNPPCVEKLLRLFPASLIVGYPRGCDGSDLSNREDK